MDEDNDLYTNYFKYENELMSYKKFHWKTVLSSNYVYYKNFNRIYICILKQLIRNLCFKPSMNSIYSINKNDWILLAKYINDDYVYTYAVVISIIPNDYDSSKYTIVFQCVHTGKIIHFTYKSRYLYLAKVTETEILKILQFNVELKNKCNIIKKKRDMYDITNIIIRARTNINIEWH